MDKILILNLTCNTFFRYNKASEEDVGYNKILADLLQPDSKEKVSHWKKTDKIILVPKHLYHYVNKTYGELYM